MVKIEPDPGSILVATGNGKLIGTVSIIEDGRIAIIFRLFCLQESEDTLSALVGALLRDIRLRGYAEAHTISPENDELRKLSLADLEFSQGNLYRWYYKTI